MKRPASDPDGRQETATEECRRELHVGAGLCLGSALGYGAASIVGSTTAMALFGAAVPILACQVGLQYRLLGRIRREPTEGEAFADLVRWRRVSESYVDPLRGNR